mgnify:CR=1 FL=1
MSNGITFIFNGKKIKLCQNVIDTMLKYIQKEITSKEAGGILVGKENKSNKNIIVNHITVPMLEDKRKYNKFIRKDKRHVEVFKNLYRRSKKTLRYIGEWHTHPEAIPNFSEIDLNNWKKISKESDSNNNYYHIIVGYDAIKIWVIESEEYSTKLIGTIFWKEI